MRTLTKILLFVALLIVLGLVFTEAPFGVIIAIWIVILLFFMVVAIFGVI